VKEKEEGSRRKMKGEGQRGEEGVERREGGGRGGDKDTYSTHQKNATPKMKLPLFDCLPEAGLWSYQINFFTQL